MKVRANSRLVVRLEYSPSRDLWICSVTDYSHRHDTSSYRLAFSSRYIGDLEIEFRQFRRHLAILGLSVEFDGRTEFFVDAVGHAVRNNRIDKHFTF